MFRCKLKQCLSCFGDNPTTKDSGGQESENNMRDLDVNILDLEEAIYGSELILTYIVQEGIEVERDVLNTIIEAKRRIKDGPLSVDFEIKFWTVFNKLTNQIKPVTILSLKSSS